MKSIQETRETLEKHREELKEKYKVREIGMLGSYVRGEQKDASDVDILVEFGGPVGFFKFLELEEYLEGLLGARVDLVSKKALKPRTGSHILKEVIMV